VTNGSAIALILPDKVDGTPSSAEMTRQLAELKLRSRHSAEEDLVFAARNGKPLAHRNATRRGFEFAAERAGIEGVSFHSMRYEFASRMIAKASAQRCSPR
jgi:site-specific recombinase XerC